MERLKNMGLKQSFFVLSVLCMAAALILAFGIYRMCGRISERYPNGGVSISPGGVVTQLEQPTAEQEKILRMLGRIQIVAILVIPVSGLGAAGIIFYYLKLKTPIAVLKDGTERIRMHDLDFSIPEVSKDEMGQICAAFEAMRGELLRTNQELWRQAEERRRLNAAFAHDLRNPVTVLKGTVRQLRRDGRDEQALERMEAYTLRIERYVEAMSSIQKLEQMPVSRKSVSGATMQAELEETARVFVLLSNPSVMVSVSVQEMEPVKLDHGIFLTVAENLIGNASRFARTKISICLEKEVGMLILTVKDDGPGFPTWLVKSGPKPFGKTDESATHFGMGLYGSRVLCMKHGGELKVENGMGEECGAVVTATFADEGYRC